ncbi:MAG: hypothetical protein AB1918_08200 [Pseudomonadota bacterium]
MSWRLPIGLAFAGVLATAPQAAAQQQEESFGQQALRGILGGQAAVQEEQ